MGLIRRKELKKPVLCRPSKRWGKMEGRDKGGGDHSTPSSVSKPKYQNEGGVFTEFRGDPGGPVRSWLQQFRKI